MSDFQLKQAIFKKKIKNFEKISKIGLHYLIKWYIISLQNILGEGVCKEMKNYTEPKLEIVTLKVADVITTSLSFADLFKVSNIEDGGRASLSDYAMTGV